MKNVSFARVRSLLLSAVLLGTVGLGQLAVAAPEEAQAPPAGRTTVAAESPFSDYTAGVVAYVLLVGFLVATLLIGGLLILNLGLLSKRREDRIGGRTPSDVGILKGTMWPEEREPQSTLPAEEDPNEWGNQKVARPFLKRRKAS